ncbi:ABC transporter ATP-binding protein [Actinotignum sanguinis]|uniref:ABC transporter ATP-binding protein n=1 Tax=Actinotignum sanguinis TaxID=1445614 RepID=A0ABT5V691_9ACTO|nr:ABC transporter ATP-binding protein [Actinotignum sanguinis]MDE1656482.1 ABC transporter ATP-binding protein [Actinotignum sanguinis]MDK6787506.1 ABC transporter ATP-binding protein [Actinotignum timonense]MDK7197203.1 ABC transporter ATP-binding protein [Actinotignum sanguinis]MDK8353162.1 ABC transporter ATP-binding protein [Actinotignum sanguinis]
MSRLGAPAPVVNEASFRVNPGEILAVVGPSGCGKTSLLEAIAGILPAAGTVRIGSAAPQRIAFVSQDPVLFYSMTVRDNIEYALGERHLAPAIIRDRVDIVMALLGVDDISHRRANELSGGQAQRVALARALATRPDVLLLDEAFVHVEGRLVHRARRVVREEVRRFGARAIVVTHDIDEAFLLGDRLLVMSENGRIAALGTPSEVYRHPVSPSAARFLGIPNIFPGQLSGAVRGDTSAREGCARINLGRCTYELPCAAEVSSLPAGAVVVTYFPAEQVALYPLDAAVAPTHNAGAAVPGMKGRIISRTFARAFTMYDVETEIGTIVARIPGDIPELARGTQVRIGIRSGWVGPARAFDNG